MKKHKYLVTIIIFTLTGYFSIVLAYLIPSERMIDNIMHDVKIFEQEISCQPIPGQRDTYLDNEMDAIMLLECAYDGKESALEKAIYVPHEDLGSHNKAVQRFVEKYSDLNHKQGKSVTYERYWHGYLVLLKPLYFLMNYGTIRRIMGYIQVCIIISIIVIVTQRGKWMYSIPVTMSYLFLNPHALADSLQYNSMFMLSYLYLLFILLNNSYFALRKNWGYAFFVVGCLASYFDYLTYPLLSYGIAITFLITEYQDCVKSDLVEIIRCGILWAMGYVIMWGMKWGINLIFSCGKFLDQLLNIIVFRAVGGGLGEKYTHISVLIDEIYYYNFHMYFVVIVFCVICMLRKYKKFRSDLIVMAVPYVLISMLPVIWDQLIISHAFFHNFTYRKYGVTIFAIGCLGIKCIIEKVGDQI